MESNFLSGIKFPIRNGSLVPIIQVDAHSLSLNADLTGFWGVTGLDAGLSVSLNTYGQFSLSGNGSVLGGIGLYAGAGTSVSAGSTTLNDTFGTGTSFGLVGGAAARVKGIQLGLQGSGSGLQGTLGLPITPGVGLGAYAGGITTGSATISTPPLWSDLLGVECW